MFSVRTAPVQALFLGACVVVALTAACLRVRRPLDPPRRPVALAAGENARFHGLLLARGAPDDRAARLRYAQQLEAHRLIAAAGHEYAALLSRAPDSTPAARGLARICVLQGKPDEAARILSGVSDPTAQEEAARALCLAGMPQQALDRLRRIASPGTPERLRTEASARLDLDDVGSAVALLEARVRRAPDDTEAALLLARALTMADPSSRWASASEALTSAIRAGTRSASLLYYIGRAAERHGDTVAAARAYRQAVAIDPRLAPAYARLVAILARSRSGRPEIRAAACRYRGLYERTLNNPLGAARAFAEEARIDPASIAAYLDGAACLEEVGRASEAIQTLRRALQIHPHSPELWSRLALTCSEWNRPGEALKAASGYAQAGGPRLLSVARLLEGRIYLKIGQNDRAREAFQKANQADPGDRSVHYWLARAILDRAGDRNSAAGAVDHLRLALQGDQPETETTGYLIALGDACQRAGQPDEAIAALERALEQDATRTEAYPLLAQALRKRGDDGAASAALALFDDLDAAGKQERALLRAVEREGKAPAPRLALADFYMERGDLDAARRIYLPAVRFGQPPASFLQRFRMLEAVLGVPGEGRGDREARPASDEPLMGERGARERRAAREPRS